MGALTTLVLAIGVNQSGDPALAALRFAESDAEKFAHTIQQVDGDADQDGGVQGRLGRSPSLSDFRAQMDQVERTARREDRLVFYFSGHADDRGLHFRDGFLPRETLHAWLDHVKAETKLIVIDACFSGSLASKGAEVAPEFELPKIDLDKLTGTVFLTAASSRDVAFESEELGGSVFTHYLVTGLGGKADLNADSLVTVEELYQYTYREMQLRNMSLPGARTQRPEFHAELHGRGALVVARPRATESSLLVDPGILGTIQLASLNGLGTMSVYSDGTKTTAIRVPAGDYRAVILRGNRVGEARVAVGREGGTRLLAGDFQWHEVDSTRGYTKGLAAPATTIAAVGLRMTTDRTVSSGPELELQKELGSMPGSTFTARVVTLGALRQLHGETQDERTDIMAGSLGLGTSLALTSSTHRRVLVGLTDAAEWQEWESSDGRLERSFTAHPTLVLGLDLDLDESLSSKSVALRYDSDYATDPATGTVRRRDSYFLGVGFKP